MFIRDIATFATMITESIIRKKFVHETITEGINKIFSEQQKVFQARFNSRTGRLQSFLSSHSFDRQISDGRYSVYINMYAHLRFLDMQYRRQDVHPRPKKANIYNKVVWGILYREVFPELRYGFTDEVRQQLRAQLQQALNP